MTAAAALLTDLRRRGVVLFVEGQRLRYRAPTGTYTDADRAVVRQHLPELLVLLGYDLADGDAAALRTRYRDDLTDAERGGLRAEADTGDPLAMAIMQAVICGPEPCAWRLYSHRLGREVWIARDAAAVAAVPGNGLPVLLAADLERLRAWRDRRLADLLDLLAVFPGARLGEHDNVAGTA